MRPHVAKHGRDYSAFFDFFVKILCGANQRRYCFGAFRHNRTISLARVVHRGMSRGDTYAAALPPPRLNMGNVLRLRRIRPVYSRDYHAPLSVGLVLPVKGECLTISHYK